MKEDRLVYRVIVVDDDHEFSQWLCSLLNKSEDFELLGQADNGAEAITLVTSTNPDVVIVDIFMPETDGFEVTRYIHRHLPEVRVILISAYEEPVYEKLAREDGALAFIPKSKLSLDSLRQGLH